jgi:hypothetical protein
VEVDLAKWIELEEQPSAQDSHLAEGLQLLFEVELVMVIVLKGVA